MSRDFPNDWMWSQAFDMLARAKRLHREIFRPSGSGSRHPAWEPPVDILETTNQVLVLVALPGVSLDAVAAAIEGNDLIAALTSAPCQGTSFRPSAKQVRVTVS